MLVYHLWESIFQVFQSRLRDMCAGVRDIPISVYVVLSDRISLVSDSLLRFLSQVHG